MSLVLSRLGLPASWLTRARFEGAQTLAAAATTRPALRIRETCGIFRALPAIDRHSVSPPLPRPRARYSEPFSQRLQRPSRSGSRVPERKRKHGRHHNVLACQTRTAIQHDATPRQNQRSTNTCSAQFPFLQRGNHHCASGRCRFRILDIPLGSKTRTDWSFPPMAGFTICPHVFSAKPLTSTCFISQHPG